MLSRPLLAQHSSSLNSISVLIVTQIFLSLFFATSFWFRHWSTSRRKKKPFNSLKLNIETRFASSKTKAWVGCEISFTALIVRESFFLLLSFWLEFQFHRKRWWSRRLIKHQIWVINTTHLSLCSYRNRLQYRLLLDCIMRGTRRRIKKKTNKSSGQMSVEVF